MGKFQDLTGMTFGKLTVVSQAPSKRHKCGKLQIYWNCKCECGKLIKPTTSDLKSKTKPTQACHSCAAIKHGHTKNKKFSSTYYSWVGMKSRCSNSNQSNSYRYITRGIKYDPAWEDFEIFLKEMGERPKGTTLERVDNDGDYCKENCIWATIKTQNRNTSNNINITYQGKTQCLTDWANELGLNYMTLRNRLKVSNMSIEEAFTKPVGRWNK